MSEARDTGVCRRREPGNGNGDEAGMRDERAVVGKRALQRFGGDVDARRRPRAQRRHVEAIEDLQRLDERDAGDRRRSGHHVVPAIGTAHRFPLDGSVRGEVAPRHEPAVRERRRLDAPCDVTGVEGVGSASRDGTQ